MATTGTVKLVAVWEMLEACAPGHERILGEHHWRIYYQGKTDPTFPKGQHSKNKEIERGQVKKMIRHLGIEVCAKRVLPGLFQ